MKHILLLSLLLLTKASFAQKDTVGLNIPLKNGYVVYEQVVSAPGRPKAALFSNAKTALVNYFNDTKNVIQSDDKDNGQVIGRGLLVIISKGILGHTDYFNDRFLVQVDCKDNRYRIRVLNQQLDCNNEFFTPEQFLGKLTGDWKSLLTKREARLALVDMNNKVIDMLAYLIKQMEAKSDDF